MAIKVEIKFKAGAVCCGGGHDDPNEPAQPHVVNDAEELSVCEMGHMTCRRHVCSCSIPCEKCGMENVTWEHECL